MTTLTQALVMTLLGAVVLRLIHEDAHLYYVRPWMMWPLLVSAAMLLVFSVVVGLRARSAGPVASEVGDPAHDVEHRQHADHAGHDDHDDDDDHAPMTAWLLLLPVLLVFLVAPNPLGAYVAERRANEIPQVTDSGFSPLPDDGVVEMKLDDFLTRAVYDDERSLEGRDVALTGFASFDDEGRWYVTRLALGCCAADATAYRVRVDSAPAPERDSWVRVTGTWKPSAPSQQLETPTPVIVAEQVQPVQEPKNPYE